MCICMHNLRNDQKTNSLENVTRFGTGKTKRTSQKRPVGGGGEGVAEQGSQGCFADVTNRGKIMSATLGRKCYEG